MCTVAECSTTVAERFCVIVPHYNHAAELAAYLPSLVACGLPVLVVDDASEPRQREALRRLLEDRHGVELIQRDHNGGKGAAVVAGIRAARVRGYTHGIGVDADGQHDPADVARIRAEAEAHPGSIVSGLPIFGTDIPRSRLYGRMITNGLVRLETGSLMIRDAMCGFRCYPLAVVADLCDGYRVRYRMDFDPEILVRAVWRGVSVRYVDTRVRYPQGGVSHFRMFRDNVAMTWMHVRLIVGGMRRVPARILRGRPRAWRTRMWQRMARWFGHTGRSR